MKMQIREVFHTLGLPSGSVCLLLLSRVQLLCDPHGL